ncbi:MAG: endonuclease/exonuclease/phosphatase family protein [Dehalococcoidia bacterium]|nr:endonuclease/exonuclease/phosphatase family protein [Dehalococcoidia bacterium]
MPSLTTFNANNFFLRYKFTRSYPGSKSKEDLEEAAEAGLTGFLPGVSFGHYGEKQYIVWDSQRRQLAARALKEPDGVLPDILCLQEVENIQAIRVFNQRYLSNYYPYSLLIDGYDPRNIDVGLLSLFPIRRIRTHVDDVYKEGERREGRIFSRDCLEAEIELPDGALLTLFINHLKSKLVVKEKGESDEKHLKNLKDSHERRLGQAQAVCDYVRERFEGQHNQALYAVVGDFNDTALSPWVAPLLESPHLTDIVATYRPVEDRWTHYWQSKGYVSQIDFILVSRALRERIARVVETDSSHIPHIERRGLAYRKLNAAGETLPREATLVHFEPDLVTSAPSGVSENEKVNFQHPRYPEVIDDWKDNISDHCPVKVWF